MIIRDTIQQWPYLTWGGSYAGTDNLSVDLTHFSLTVLKLFRIQWGRNLFELQSEGQITVPL